MSTHNIGFYEDLTKLSLNYHQIRTLFLLLFSGQLRSKALFTLIVKDLIKQDHSLLNAFYCVVFVIWQLIYMLKCYHHQQLRGNEKGHE